MKCLDCDKTALYLVNKYQGVCKDHKNRARLSSMFTMMDRELKMVLRKKAEREAEIEVGKSNLKACRFKKARA
jgi:hypothetical protein